MQDKECVQALAIVLTAISSDNPTVQSAWENLQTAVMIAEGTKIPNRISLLERRAEQYGKLTEDMIKLRRKAVGEIFKPNSPPPQPPQTRKWWAPWK